MAGNVEQVNDSKFNEPPPPYPGIAGSDGDTLLSSSTRTAYSQPGHETLPPPPPYPGTTPGGWGRHNQGLHSPPIPHPQQQDYYTGPPFDFSRNAPDCVLAPVTVPPGGDCPRCGIGRMDDRPDIALIICLILMAFLFTPLTLCCIPCAFHKTCPSCGYQAA